MRVYILQGWSYDDVVIDGIYKYRKAAEKRKAYVERIPRLYELVNTMSFEEASEIVYDEAKRLSLPEHYAEMSGWIIVEEYVK